MVSNEVPPRAGTGHVVKATRRTLITVLPVGQIPADTPKLRRKSIGTRRRIIPTRLITALQIKIPNPRILPHSPRQNPATR
jgi:hypothetical protein